MTTVKGQKVDLTFGPAIFLWISPLKEDSIFFLMKIIVRIKKFNQRYPPSISNSNGSSASLCPTRRGHWCHLPDDQTRRHCLADANFTRTQLFSGSEAFNKRHYDSNIKEDAANAAETQQRAFENPAEEQTAVFSAQQDGSYTHACAAAQPGGSGGQL